MAITLDRPLVATQQTPRRSRRRRVSASGYAAVIVLVCVIALAIIGPPLWRWDAVTQHIDLRLQNPTAAHPLGTDSFGRDVLGRLLLGARWSLTGAAVVCAGTSLLGFLIGMLAASSGRWVDTMLGRLIESLMALPGLVTALALTSVLGPSFPNLLVAMVVTSWPSYARLYRALILKERAAQYVESAVALGATRRHVVFRHILPNVIGPAAVLATANFGGVILGLAGLSFLGFGMQPPTPEWGMMINEARPYFQRFPWQMVAPGLCIAVTVLAVNLMGDALRDALDPRVARARRTDLRHTTVNNKEA